MTKVANFAGGYSHYQYKTTLPVGEHSFSFVFSQPSGGTATLPFNGIPLSGPDVHPFWLNSGSVSPGNVALVGQPVTYAATYVSPSGIAPTRAEVDISGVPHAMTGSGTNYAAGVKYTYTTSSLPVGTSYYRFVFSDGSGPAIYEIGSMPRITPISVTGSVSPSKGIKTTKFTYKATYKDTAGRSATKAQVCIDGACHNMTFVSGSPATGAVYRYTTTLAARKHTYAFLFADGTTSWTNPVSPGVFWSPASAAPLRRRRYQPAPSSCRSRPATRTTTPTDSQPGCRIPGFHVAAAAPGGGGSPMPVSSVG